jgi:hypothetical protein
MADYRTDDGVRVERRGGAGKTIAIILAVLLLIAAALFLTGFWKVNTSGELKAPEISVKGGEVPDVDVDSKKVVVGTKQTTVDVPKVETEKKTVDVPVVGVTDGKTDK